MTQGMKVLSIVFGIIIFVVALLVLAYIYFFVGFTPKQKYQKCAHVCEELMLLEGDIPMCQAECSKHHNYYPISGGQKTTESKKSGESSKESETNKEKYETVAMDCNYVWPQEIVEKVSRDLVLSCPSSRPWCSPVDNTYKNISCCTTYDDETKTKSDCQKLPDLLSEK